VKAVYRGCSFLKILPLRTHPWGTHDGRSWLNNHPVKGRTNYPLLFDRQFHPKPAFDAVIKALSLAKEH
jgi:GH35 family endo-1,4-beta-xylanase